MWVYVRASDVPAELAQENPIAAAYLALFKDGLLLDLGNLSGDWVQGQDLAGAAEGIAAVQQAMLDEDDLAELQQLAQMDWSALAAQSGALTGDAAGDAWSGAHPIILGGGQMQVSHNAELNALLSDLLTGQASADDFERLALLIEESAGNVTVTPQGDGVYRLRATDFNLENAGLDAEDIAFLADMTLEIAYSEDTGMLWAALGHLGVYDGTVRLAHADIAADDPRFSGKQYREDGVTKVIDLSGLLGMFKMFGD